LRRQVNAGALHAISPKGWCKLFEQAEQEKVNMNSEHQALRDRDAQVKHEKLYNNQSTQKLRAELAGPKPSPALTMANRHSHERGEMRQQHHEKTQQLLARHISERNRHLQTSHPLPAGFDDEAERERSELNADNARERERMELRHMQERDRLRSVK
jgi:hypothetical protein